MRKRIQIEGMSCEHCSNAVREVLEELGGVNVEVNYETGVAEADIDATDDMITAKIVEEEFEVIAITEL